ncbi:glycosyltransferase [Polaribacter sp. Hel1_85]|uniref:glycosyltransferase n=1 Tax=Polaribacter sp. Hel1_85 TaxID=1250005 RepID=UPI00052B8605|nr:glycosyltransferase [Polaribacter sp. Hel1_85]KGL63236.1 glycosyltransferase, GTnc family [Polaribacter sp. Hel1_85]
MKNILFILNQGPISPNANGGASVYYSHLELLYKAGFKIKLLAVQWSDSDVFMEEDYQEVRPFIKSVETYKITSITPKKGLKRGYNAVFKPALFEYFFLNAKNINYLTTYVAQNKIDLVFGDWRWAAIWACYSNLKVPVIYGHHDWEYKLAKLRTKQNLLKKLHTFQKKRVEFQLVKQVAGSISGSATEAKEIEEISNKKALYIPTTYQEIQPKNLPKNKPDIVHLGGMGTTANRLGLERFLDVCWQEIHTKNPSTKLVVVGGLKQATPSLLEKLKGKNIICKGFVADLQTVLCPEDIHIIPWEYNTGTRTRIPVILNYRQALVATKASVLAFPELKNKENAILCDDLQDMTKQICTLLEFPEHLKSISKKGKDTFRNHFTSENHVDAIKNYINKILLK